MAQAALNENRTGKEAVYLGLELGMDKWVLCFYDGHRQRLVTLMDERACVVELVLAWGKVKKKWHLGADVGLVTCYEAGRHGFWVHRELESQSVKSHVVDSSSIEMARRRRNKTDKTDAMKLARLLARFERGETNALRVVRVPTVNDEDERRPHREIFRLKKERTGLTNRIKGILFLCGVRLRKINGKFKEWLEGARQVDGSPIPAHLKLDAQHTYERWCLTNKHLDEIKAARNERLRAQRAREQPDKKPKASKHAHAQPVCANDPVAAMVLRLQELFGIGEESSWLLVAEFFGWRKFKNRRELAGSAGLVPTERTSCSIHYTDGISKAGNPRVRWMMQEIAWGWLKHQPDSALARWYREKFGAGGKRNRKVGGVALARRLLIDLWRYLEQGVVPDGARLKPTT